MDEIVVRGKLKLKKSSGGVGKKKHKSTMVSEAKTEAMLVAGEDSDEARISSDSPGPSAVPQQMKTKAELAFEKRQKELQAERVKKKAQVSHRERVEKFNKYLENLTELNDIPKVSWTK